MPLRHIQVGVALASALAALSFAAPAAQAQPDDGVTVDAIDAAGRSPTSVTLRIAGKSITAVKAEIRDAARTVCLNAVSNRDMWMLDYTGCREATQLTAMNRYRTIVRAHPEIISSGTFAGDFAIHVATR